MAFADPLANITLATVAQTLPRVTTSGQRSTYRKTDGSLVGTISHQTNKTRVRSMARIDQFLDVNSDLVLENLGVYLVIDRPITGFSQTQIKDLITCVTDWMTASSKAAMDKLYGLES